MINSHQIFSESAHGCAISLQLHLSSLVYVPVVHIIECRTVFIYSETAGSFFDGGRPCQQELEKLVCSICWM